MKLDKRVRVIELMAAINHLKKNPMLMSPEEVVLLESKEQELQTLRPTPPPYPEGGDVDLRCSRSSIEEDVTRLTKKAQQRLDQIERETDPARKARLEFDPIIVRLRAAQNRLSRFDQLQTWQVWRGQQEENKRNAER